MYEPTVSEALIERTRLSSIRHDALPSAIAQQLPAIDWNMLKASPPEVIEVSDKSSNAPLPKSDVVIVTWTLAEWQALHHVFFGTEGGSKWRDLWTSYCRDYYQIHQYMVDVKRTYQGGAPSLSSAAWGSYRLARVNDLTVLLIKSGMHLAQDGTHLPLLNFVERICNESKPNLFLSIGTAGAVREQDALGSVVVTNQAYFHLLEEFSGADFNNTTVQSRWTPSTAYLEAAGKQLIQVTGEPVYPLSPQYPENAVIEPNAPDSKINVVLDSPIITTDGFLFGTTTNHLQNFGCIVEMDDAVVGLACHRNNTNFGFVRNVSDPVMNAQLPSQLQTAWAGYIYSQRGLQTSFNGALTTWALIAGEAAQQ